MTTQPSSSKPTLAEQRIITVSRKARRNIRDAAEALGVTYQRVPTQHLVHALIERQHVEWHGVASSVLRQKTSDVAARFECSESAVRGARLRRRAA